MIWITVSIVFDGDHVPPCGAAPDVHIHSAKQVTARRLRRPEMRHCWRSCDTAGGSGLEPNTNVPNTALKADQSGEAYPTQLDITPQSITATARGTNKNAIWARPDVARDSPSRQNTDQWQNGASHRAAETWGPILRR